MKFTKMQGLGNDYVYVNCFKEKIDNPPDFEMEMYNADGSRGEMCGNGIRCVAKYVYDYGLTDKTHISVETLGGIKYLDLTVKDGKVALVRVDMGEPELAPEKIPIIMKGYSDETDRVLNAQIKVDGKEYHMTGVSMGNPHDVVYIDDVQGLDIEKIGPKFENHGNACVGERIRRDTCMWNWSMCCSSREHFKRIYRARSRNPSSGRKSSD